MNTGRIKRINELLRREIGEALFHVMKEDNFDLSAVTVTHVITSRNLRSARVLVSIRDHHDERENMLALLRKCGPRIQWLINKNIILKYTPRLSFELDLSVEKGDQLLSLLSKMEQEESERPAHPDAGQITT